MNQDLNNLNQTNFNSQDSNNVNQTNFNNQINNGVIQTGELYNQNVNENSTLYSSDPIMNENKPSKKNNLPIIIAVVVSILVVVGLLFGFGGKSKSNSEKGEVNKSGELKKITYFNSSTKNEKDKLFLSYDALTENGIGIIFAIDEKGVANNLKGDGYSFGNGVFSLDQYKSDQLVGTINNFNFYFNLELEKYEKNNNEEKLADGLIIYTDGNYVITENNIGSYSLYYKYDETYNKYSTEEQKWGSWYVIRLDFCDSLEEAKEVIEEIENHMDICSYDVEEGFNSSVCVSGKLLNYKEYKNIDDVLVDSLADYGLYVNSYKNISFVDNGELVVKNHVALTGVDDSETEFEIEFEAQELKPEQIITTTKLNGKQVQIRESYSLYYATIKTDLGYIEMLVDLAYGADETKENVIKALTDTFKNTK